MDLLTFFSLLGGIGMFLYGMTLMSTGLKNAAGNNLRVILEKATSNRIMAVGVGCLVTLMIQSSSATDVMVIGFVNSGLMTLYQAIGVIMGANIGTTITAQLTAFNLSAYAPLILFTGAIMYLFMKRAVVRDIGSVIMGFGMLFQGIGIMKAAIAPLSQSQTFINILEGLSNPILAILFGVAFTAMLQSSSSSIVIFQAFVVQGILAYDTAVYLVIGAAIGSVTPNLLASLTANRNGKRSALLNLCFNLIRAVILASLITIFPQILRFIQNLSPGDVGRQIANTHTIFAITAVLIQLPFSQLIVKLTYKLLPELESETRRAKDQTLMYLNEFSTTSTSFGNVPAAFVLSQAKHEIVRMGYFALENLRTAVDCFFEKDEDKIQLVLDGEETVDYLDNNITKALVGLHAHKMTERDRENMSMLLLDVADLERISDHAVNLTEYVVKLRERKGTISEAGIADLRAVAKAALESVEYSLQVFAEDDFANLSEASRLEDIVDQVTEAGISGHVSRLMNDDCSSYGGVVFTDFITDLERCSDHAINVAYSLSGKTDPNSN